MKCLGCGEKLDKFYHQHARPIKIDRGGSPGRGRNRDVAHPRRAARRRGIKSRSLLAYFGG